MKGKGRGVDIRNEGGGAAAAVARMIRLSQSGAQDLWGVRSKASGPGILAQGAPGIQAKSDGGPRNAAEIKLALRLTALQHRIRPG